MSTCDENVSATYLNFHIYCNHLRCFRCYSFRARNHRTIRCYNLYPCRRNVHRRYRTAADDSCSRDYALNGGSAAKSSASDKRHEIHACAHPPLPGASHNA